MVALFCIFLLFIWCYNNKRNRSRNNSPENSHLADLGGETSTNLIAQQNSGSNTRPEASQTSQGEATTSPTEREPLQEEDQLPPKYEDIENHPIVTQHSLNSTDTDTVPPPKYEDIV